MQNGPYQANNNSKYSPLPTAAKSSNTTASQTNPTGGNQAYKDKLSPQWTQIYRKLHSKDAENEGVIPVNEFEKALRETNTFLSRQDITAIKTHYGVNRSNSPQKLAQIDYDDLSQQVVGGLQKHH